MEGVGARLGRSSTRYGPATVFTGPVRKWKKKWVHVTPSTKKDNNTSSASAAAAASVVNGASASDGSNGSHLLLFKWAPLSQSSNGNGNGNGNEDGKSESNSPSDDPVATETVAEDPPRRRFKYVPIAVLEEQKREVTEIEEDDKAEEDDNVEEEEKKKEITEIEEDDKVEEDSKVEEEDASVAEPSVKKTEVEEKPDMNDVPMEEDNQEEEKIVRQDLNESTMDSGLNLNANDAGVDADSENNQKGAEPLEE